MLAGTGIAPGLWDTVLVLVRHILLASEEKVIIWANYKVHYTILPAE